MKRKVILFIATSLDGFIAGEKGEIDWLFTDQDYGYTSFLNSVDTLLMGRKTYEQVLQFGSWPYADKTTYVFTSNPSPAADDNVIFSSDPVGVTTWLRDQSGTNIWLVGGSSIVTTLVSHKLVHEMMIYIHPILLAKGIPLFKNISKKIHLSLRDSTQYNSGLVKLHYHIT